MLILRLPGIEPCTWLNTRQKCWPHQIEIQSEPGGILVCSLPLSGKNPCIVWTLHRPFQAFGWFPFHKPSSNSTLPVAWITELAKGSQYLRLYLMKRSLSLNWSGAWRNELLSIIERTNLILLCREWTRFEVALKILTKCIMSKWVEPSFLILAC